MTPDDMVLTFWSELREDLETITDWLVGYWPGLEDGMPWPDNDDHEVIEAARRVQQFLGEVDDPEGCRVPR